MKIELGDKSWLIKKDQKQETPFFERSVYNQKLNVIACGIGDKGMGIWDVATGRLKHFHPDHAPFGRQNWPGFGISAKLHSLIMVHEDTVIIKDLTTGVLLHRLEVDRPQLDDPEAMQLEGLCLSHDESLMAVTDHNAGIYVFDMKNLDQYKNFNGSVASPMMCRFSKNNHWLAASGGGELIVWDLDNEDEQFQHSSPMVTEHASDLLFTSDNQFLVMPVFPDNVQILDINKPEKDLFRPDCEDVAFAGLSADDRLYFFVFPNKWFTQSLTEQDRKPLDLKDAPCKGSSHLPDDNGAESYVDPTPVRFSADIPPGMAQTLLKRFSTNIDEFQQPKQIYKWLIHLSPEQGFALLRWGDQFVRYDLRRMEAQTVFPELRSLHSTQYHEGRNQYIGCDGDDLIFMNNELNTIVHRLRTRDSIKAYALSPDGKLAYCAFLSYQVIIFDIETGARSGVLQHEYRIDGLTVSNDGRFLYSLASGDIYGWDLTTQRQLYANEDIVRGGQAIFLLDDHGKYLYVGNGQAVEVFSTLEAIATQTLTRHEAEIKDICWSSDKSRIFTVASDGNMGYWDFSTNTTGMLKESTEALEMVSCHNGKCYSFDNEAVLRRRDEKTGELETIWAFQLNGIAIFDREGYHHSEHFSGIESPCGSNKQILAYLGVRCSILPDLVRDQLFENLERGNQIVLATALTRLTESGWKPEPDLLNSAINYLKAGDLTSENFLNHGVLTQVIDHLTLTPSQQIVWDSVCDIMKQEDFSTSPEQNGDENLSNAQKQERDKVQSFETQYREILREHRKLRGVSGDKALGAYFDAANLDFGFSFSGREDPGPDFFRQMKQAFMNAGEEVMNMEDQGRQTYFDSPGIQRVMKQNPNLQKTTHFLEMMLHESFHLYQVVCLKSARDYMEALRYIRYARLAMFALNVQGKGCWNRKDRNETVFSPFGSLSEEDSKLILDDISYASGGLNQILDTYHNYDGLRVIDLIEGGAFHYQKLVFGGYDMATPENPIYTKAYHEYSMKGGYNHYVFVLMTHIALRYGNLQDKERVSFVSRSPVAVFRVLLESVDDYMEILKDGLSLPSNILTRDPKNAAIIEEMIGENVRLRQGIAMFLHLVALMEQKVTVHFEIKGQSFNALRCLDTPVDKHFAVIVRELTETFPAANEDAFLIAMMLEPSLAVKYACWCMAGLEDMEITNEFGRVITIRENRVPMEAIHQFMELVETPEANCCEDHPPGTAIREILTCNNRVGLPNMIRAITGRDINELYC